MKEKTNRSESPPSLTGNQLSFVWLPVVQSPFHNPTNLERSNSVTRSAATQTPEPGTVTNTASLLAHLSEHVLLEMTTNLLVEIQYEGSKSAKIINSH